MPELPHAPQVQNTNGRAAVSPVATGSRDCVSKHATGMRDRFMRRDARVAEGGALLRRYTA